MQTHADDIRDQTTGLMYATATLGLNAVIALLLARRIASLLFGVKPDDPTVFGGIVVLVAAIALLSSWLPARRAAGVDPMQALRDE